MNGPRARRLRRLGELGRVGVLASALTWSRLLAAAPPAAAEVDSSSWVVFASSGCAGCDWLEQRFFPGIREHAPAGLPPILFVDLDVEGNYEVLIEVEDTLGVTGEEFPALLVGSDMTYGEKALAKWAKAFRQAPAAGTLPPEVVTSIRGAVSLRSFLDHKAAPFAPPPAAAPEGEADASAALPATSGYASAHVLYFETTGCKGCARAEKQLAYLGRRFPDKRLRRVDAVRPEGRALQMAVATGLALPEEDCLATPMFASGACALYGKELRDAALIELAQAAPPSPFWLSWDEGEALAAARARLRGLAASFTLPAVVGWGLVDGVNPCAFAVIVFLVSYLTLSRGLGKQYALLYGLIFCLGVFACYFLIGLGFSRILTVLEQSRPLLRAAMVGAGLLCLLFAAGAAVDVWRARRSGAGAMRFGMPKPIRAATHHLIRRNVGRHLFGVGALGLGFAVSGLELVCTGQIYLPVLVFINSTAPGGRSLVLLTVYNLAFVLPLVAVVLVGVAGSNSRRLAQWAARRAVPMRACTALGLLALGAAMFYLAAR